MQRAVEAGESALTVLSRWMSESRAPWFEPYETVARSVCAPVADSVARALSSLSSPVRLAAGPLRFVAQSELPEAEAYEAYIDRTAKVPTRDNLHDLFNGLVWHTFPQTKRRLNELQAAQIAAQGQSRVRGPVRDALTLFDENAALLEAPDELVQALRQRDWHRVFVEQREVWLQMAQVVVFGHAMLEQLMQPRKNLCAHVWVVPRGEGSLDARVAASLNVDLLGQRPRPFLPLPVLGVPGWCLHNSRADFYDDPSVFRPLPMAAVEVGLNRG